MRASTFFSSVLLSTALSGCVSQEPPASGSDLFLDMSEPKASVSGFVIDPEAMYVLQAAWPAEDPEPPTADLFDGAPLLEYSSIQGASVSLVSGDLETSHSTTTEHGVWQVFDVPVSDTTSYVMKAQAPAGGVVLGASMDAPPVTLPALKYVPTYTLRPVVPSVPLCKLLVTTMVSESGALSALAKTLKNEKSPIGTVADLQDPAKTGGVLLAWVYEPSFSFDWFQYPTHGIAAEASSGTVYAINWAQPGTGGALQSPMGFTAVRNGVSSIGYYAIVQPPGASGELSLQFHDEETTPEGEEPGPHGPRPWPVPPFVTEILPGISVARIHALSSFEEPDHGEDPHDEPAPPPDFSWLCMPLEHEEE